MKKIIFILLTISLLFPSIVFAREGLTPNAKNAIMMDYDTEEILYGKDENRKISVASLTKMMGLIIIFEKIENGAIKTDEIVTVSKNAKNMGGTQIWLEEGEKISIDDLLKGITMASANDAMVAMAERVSGTEGAFVDEMNKKVKELGLKNTHFVNSTGLDEEGGYSSPYDMALIAKELIKHKKALEYTSKYEDYIREDTDNKTWIVNTNKLLKFYSGVDGLKTGYTDNAGSSIAVTCLKDGLRLIALTFGYNDTKTRNSEMMALLDYGYNQYSSKTILEKDKKVKDISLNKADKNSVGLLLKENVKVTTKKEEPVKKYSYNIKLNEIKYPVKTGDTLGTLYLKDGNKTLKESPLVSDTDILKAGFIKQYFRVLNDMFSGNAI